MLFCNVEMHSQFCRESTIKIRFQNVKYWSDKTFNPIPAGVLENQDMLGGGQFDPSLNPMFYVHDTSLESSCALLLESAKKIANFQKSNFFSQNPVIKKKFLPKKNCQKNEKLYIFENPLIMPFQKCKIFAKF